MDACVSRSLYIAGSAPLGLGPWAMSPAFGFSMGRVLFFRAQYIFGGAWFQDLVLSLKPGTSRRCFGLGYVGWSWMDGHCAGQRWKQK